MINSLKIASAGYLKRQTKAALVIAVAGYLNFSGVTPPSGGSASVGVKAFSANDKDAEKIKKRLQKDENEWMVFMDAFIRTINYSKDG